MNNLQVFQSNEFGEMSILLINGKEYFPATACAKILGYVEPQKAVRMHCKGVSKMDTPTAGGSQEVNYIPEGDLYRLIIRSKLPAAERFERWVFDDLLPTIRKQSTYTPDIAPIITQTATAVAAEVVKQLIPLFKAALNPDQNSGLDAWHMEDAAPPRRPRKRIFGIIAKLDIELRRQVEDMLFTGCTYLEIVQFLNTQGIKLSQMAVCNYARSLER